MKDPKKRDPFELLKAWVHWKKLEKGLDEDDLLFVRDIDNLISQVGTLRAQLEAEREYIGTLREAIENGICEIPNLCAHEFCGDLWKTLTLPRPGEKPT